MNEQQIISIIEKQLRVHNLIPAQEPEAKQIDLLLQLEIPGFLFDYIDESKLTPESVASINSSFKTYLKYRAEEMFSEKKQAMENQKENSCYASMIKQYLELHEINTDDIDNLDFTIDPQLFLKELQNLSCYLIDKKPSSTMKDKFITLFKEHDFDLNRLNEINFSAPEEDILLQGDKLIGSLLKEKQHKQCFSTPKRNKPICIDNVAFEQLKKEIDDWDAALKNATKANS